MEYLGKANNIKARRVPEPGNAVFLDLVDAVVRSIPHAITQIPVLVR